MKAFKKWTRAERARAEREKSRRESSYEVAYSGITEETIMNLVESDSDGSESHTLSHKTYVSKSVQQHLDPPAHGRLAPWGGGGWW